MKNTFRVMKPEKQTILALIMFAVFFSGVYAQADDGYYCSLDAGYGTTDILVKGLSQQFIIDPKICLSPRFMIGSKFGINNSTDNLLALEEQVYLRWNFLRLGKPEKRVNIFVQSGIGMLAMYREADTPFGDIKNNRGSFMFDAAAGVTIPLNSRWHVEASVRSGYPHIVGASVTAGYTIPLPQKSRYGSLAASDEVIKRILIAGVDSIMFGPDTGQYNADIDQNVQDRNETILNSVAKTLKENPNFRVRIEGHANPVTNSPAETDKLIALSKIRADAIAGMLKAKGVKDEQLFVIGLGGAKIISYDIRNMNRRVELIVIRVNNN